MDDTQSIKTQDITTLQRLMQINALGLPIIAARGLPETRTMAYSVVHNLSDGASEFVIPASQTPFGARHFDLDGEMQTRYNQQGTLNIPEGYEAAVKQVAGGTSLDNVEVRGMHDASSGLYFCFLHKKGDNTELSATHLPNEVKTIDELLSSTDMVGLPIMDELQTTKLPEQMEYGWQVAYFLKDGSPVLILPTDSSVNPFVGRMDKAYGVYDSLGVNVSEALARVANATDVEGVAKAIRTKRNGESSNYVAFGNAVTQGIYANGKITCFPAPSDKIRANLLTDSHLN
jgi:hypothetical protein